LALQLPYGLQIYVVQSLMSDFNQNFATAPLKLQYLLLSMVCNEQLGLTINWFFKIFGIQTIAQTHAVAVWYLFTQSYLVLCVAHIAFSTYFACECI